MQEEPSQIRSGGLNCGQFAAWCNRLGISSQARAHIEHIRASPPARRVSSRVGNVIGRYPSQKMGVSIQFESRTVELAIIYRLEHDPDVLEYYDQPPEIKLSYRHPDGRSMAFNSVQDFFVLRRSAGEYVQGKPEAKLIEDAARMPGFFVKGDGGSWRCLPGEEYAAKFGLAFRVVSSADLDVVWQNNIVFLEDYFRLGDTAVPSEVVVRLSALVASQPGIMLDALRRAAANFASVDDINALIAGCRIYTNLHEAPLTEPARVRLFQNAETAATFPVVTTDERGGYELARAIEVKPGSCVEWDGRPLQIVHVGLTSIAFVNGDQTPVELSLEHWSSLLQRGQIKSLEAPKAQDPTKIYEEISRSSASRLEDANRRARAVVRQAHIAQSIVSIFGQDAEDPAVLEATESEAASARSVRRWRKQSRDAQLCYGHGYLGFLDNKHRRGNRTKKICEAVHQLMLQKIALEYETITNRRRIHVHAQLALECQQVGLDAPSYKTFCLAVQQRSGPAQIELREGKRAAYQHQSFHWWIENDTPRHGSRPFEVAYLDHYEFPVKGRCSRTDKVLGKPWTSVLADGNTRRVLAAHMSYEEPSYRSCLMILRLCVLNHGRLPRYLVVDNGPEFRSVYFQALCAFYGIILVYRPPGQPRGGSVIERLFLSTETRFAHELVGNTQLDQNGRQLTKAVSAEENAVWPLPRLFKRFCQYLHEQYDTIEHPALGESPRAAFERGLVLHGERSHARISYDVYFKLMTMPSTPRGTATVHNQKGVRINYFDYYSPSLSDPRLAGKQVAVRYDPWDLSTAHALVGNCWIECHSNHHHLLHGRSEKEMRHAATEMRKLASLRGQQAKVTGLQLARFMAETRDEETQLLRERELANKEAMALAEKGYQAMLTTAKLPEVIENAAQVPAIGSPSFVHPAVLPWDSPVNRDDLPPMVTF